MMGHDDGYYKGLMSNRRVDVSEGHKYVLMSGCRDEALDTFGYALCAQSLLMMCGGQAPTAQILKEAIAKKEASEGQSDEGEKADVSVTAEDAIRSTRIVPESITPLDGTGIPNPSRSRRKRIEIAIVCKIEHDF